MWLSTDAVVTDSGQLDPVVPDAGQIAVEKLPEEKTTTVLGLAVVAARAGDDVAVIDLRSASNRCELERPA